MEEITITRECPDQKSVCWPPLMELIRDITLADTGDVLAIVADDPESKEVIPIWVEKAHEEMLDVETVGDSTRFIVRKTH